MSLFSPSFLCGVKFGKSIYASATKFNGLVKICIDDGRAECILQFPGSELSIENQHSRAYNVKGKICFAPAWGDYIHIFDPKTNEIESYNIGRQDYKLEYYGVLYNEKIILSPKMRGGDFLCFNLETMENSVLMKWEKIESYIPECVKYTFLRVTQVDGILFLPLYDTSQILTINLESFELKVLHVQVDNLLGIFNGANNLFLLSNSKSTVYMWNSLKNEVRECESKGTLESDNYYTFTAKLNEQTYFFPGYSSSLIVKEYLGKIEKIVQLEDTAGKLLFSEPFCSDKMIWALPFQGEEMLCISGKGIESKKISTIKLEYLDKKLFCESKVSNKRMLCEGDDMSIEEFVQGIVNLEGNVYEK